MTKPTGDANFLSVIYTKYLSLKTAPQICLTTTDAKLSALFEGTRVFDSSVDIPPHVMISLNTVHQYNF
jgi:hypothetical protein